MRHLRTRRVDGGNVATRFCHLPWLALILIAVSLFPANLSAQISREYQLKSVFLFNFAQFTEWPTNAFTATNSPFVIGVLGVDPFGKTLDDSVRGEKVHGRSLVVERYQRVEEIKTCHILFISKSEQPRLDHILETLRKKPVLTVSDIEGAAQRGVMIRFMTESNRIRFRINVGSLNDSQLTISSKLLRAAEVIPAPRNP